MATIRMKRGIQSDIETMPLLSGEMAVALDTGRVFVGTEEGTVPLGTGDMYAAIYDPTKKEQDIFAYAVPAAEKGVAGGVATLDESGKIPKAFLPEYSGGGTATGKKTVRFVIGTSVAGCTEADCDYLCDGIDDQVEINTAIQALPDTGGEIQILDGIYQITDVIYLKKKNTKLCGCGNNTVLQCAKDFEASNIAYKGTLHINGTSCTISDIVVDGNKGKFDGTYGIVVQSSYNCIQNVYIHDCMTNGIVIWNGVENRVVQNIIHDCGNVGIDTGTGTHRTIISHNIVIGSGHTGIAAGGGGSDACIISNNVSMNNKYYGFGLGYGSYWTIVGNVSMNNGIGQIDVLNGNNFVIIGNICICDPPIADAKSIKLSTSSDSETANDNIIVGNTLKGIAPTIGSNSTGNIIANNK